MSSSSNPRLGFLRAAAEAARMAVATPIASALLVAVVAGATASILATTGQTVRAEQDVLARIDEAGTRLIVASDASGGASIPNEAVARIAQLSRVEWVFGVGYASDGRNAAVGDGGAPAAVRTMWGDIPDVISVNGRDPNPGEAIVGVGAAQTLGLDKPVGGIDVRGSQIAVVGGFVAHDPLESLNSSLLATPNNEQTSVEPTRTIFILVETPDDVAAVAEAVPTVIGANDPFAITIETSETLANVRAAVAGELGKYSRSLILASLSVGLGLITLIVYMTATARRQDYGRRRALGARRLTIVVLVLTQAVVAAGVGIALGIAVGAVLTTRWTNQYPDRDFVAAISILVLLVTAAAAVPPAVLAAWRDPVRALRVP